MLRADTDSFDKIFTEDRPLLDLRAPVEFNQGAFPSATNLPLMTDLEREKIGICYKLSGQDAAINLGNKLVSGEVRDQRMQAWEAFVTQHEKGYLYCFRGGLRSKTVQQWLAEEGFDYPLIVGGYKSLRGYLIQKLESLAGSLNFIIVGGRTGTRKTDLILAAENSVDLEGRANHRGSSFGRRVGSQPNVINFENSLTIDLLKLVGQYENILLEDEGVTIGSCSVPLPLRLQIKSSPLYIVEATVDERVENILRDYVVTLSEEYLAMDAINGWENYRQSMFDSLSRIKKRLGGERYKKMNLLMTIAFDARNIADNYDAHRDWIRLLLVDYYDPMYDFQLDTKQKRIVETGDWQSIADRLVNQ